MNMPNKFVKHLSDEQERQLIENHQTSDNFRVRNRSQAILLSFQKHSIDEIAAVCRVHRTAVSRWLDNWNECGFEGLKDEEKPGRPPILSLEEAEKAFAIAMKNPKFPHRQIGEISRETGKTIGKQTLKRLVKKRLYLEKDQVGTMEANK